MDTFICSAATHITNMTPIWTRTTTIRTSITNNTTTIAITTKGERKSKRSNASGRGAGPIGR